LSVRALLDVNVLIALLDAGHLHHGLASAWLGDHQRHGWASCPITQNGCVRILSQPGYSNPLPTAEVIARLAEAAHHARHEFWPDATSLLDAQVFDRQRLLGPRQVTDAYLLALAVDRGGRFVTFDRRVPIDAVRGAQKRHCVVLA
jgi:toxin-antitoxin system PIN domain toxin